RRGGPRRASGACARSSSSARRCSRASATSREPSMAPSAFRESQVDADGFRIRYVEAGEGVPLVHLHGAGGLRLTPSHGLLARRFRVLAFEMPGFGESPVNTRTETMGEMASTRVRAIDKIGLDSFNLMGTSFGGKTALWVALQATQRVPALVLEAPAAIRQEGAAPPSGPAEEIARRLYAHPERLASMPPIDPAMRAKTQPLVQRLLGPHR